MLHTVQKQLHNYPKIQRYILISELEKIENCCKSNSLKVELSKASGQIQLPHKVKAP